MRLILHDEVFATPQTALLCAIFFMGAQGRHHIRLNPIWAPRRDVVAAWDATPNQPHPDKHAGAHFRAWYLSLPIDAQRTIQRALYVGLRDAVRSRDTLTIHDGVALSAPNLHRRLITPLLVYLEDEVNDATFIRRMASEAELAVILRCEQFGMLRFLHSGGINGVERFVKALSAQDQQRAFFIFDRDEPPPGESNQAKDARQACDSMGVPHHMWARRAIENYMPVELMRALPDYPHRKVAGLNRAQHKESVDRVERLADKRDGMDMKTSVHKVLASLYSWDKAELLAKWPRWRAEDPEARREIRELLEELFQRM
jgi:hypothetical protein